MLIKIAWKKYQVYTVVFTVLLVLGSGALSFWIYGNYQEMLKEEQDYQSQISIAKVKRDKVPSLENEVIKLRENIKEYVKILPDKKEVNTFVKKLSDFARNSGVELVSINDDNKSNQRDREKKVFDKEAFRLELVGNIFQYLKFISQIENYERFVKITDVAIKAGSYDEDMLPSDVVHNISMLVETFVYQGNEGAGVTKIQNYDKKREALLDEIKSVKNEIVIDRYEYFYDPSVRDPFIDPRPWASKEDKTEGLELKEQEKFISGVMDRISEIRNLLDMVKDSVNVPLIRRLEIQKEVAQRIIELNKEVNQSIEERWITDMTCRRKFDGEILPELNKLNQGNMDSPSGDAGITLEDLVSIRDRLAVMLEKEDFDGCLEDYNLLRSRLNDKLRNSLALDDSRNAVLNEIEEIQRRAQVTKEFNTIPLKISGIISQPERSIVIVNGLVLSEGQTLQNDLYVHRIENKVVYFEFKGEVFKVTP